MDNSIHTTYMQAALMLAERGFPRTRPNPLVGAVLVADDGRILGEGFHAAYGGDHAEVACLKDAHQQGHLAPQIAAATLYVTLEPCAHTGKTPPCVEAILKAGIKKVIVACVDPNPLVQGKGIAALQQAGVDVQIGIMEAEARVLNKRFFCFHEQKRPYIILKWAQTHDGFMAKADGSSRWISGEAARGLVHKWRDEEMAIMVGTTTAILDNPYLTSRIIGGRNPVRVVLDRELKIPTSFNVFDESAQTILFNALENYSYGAAELIKVPFDQHLLPTIMKILYERNMTSLIVEGGPTLLRSFLDLQLWDEARIFVNEKVFGAGIAAPQLTLPARPVMTFAHEHDALYIIERQHDAA
jgi:diaminohydroxyphosphoribosylaminopyrimidine deaminase/5-amino-6-(5-phosphoribosylamino)uracil reductase